MGSFALMVTKVNFIHAIELIRLCIVEYKKIIDIPHMVILPHKAINQYAASLNTGRIILILKDAETPS